jgi:hypothetical protein
MQGYSPGVDIDLLIKELNDPENIRALETATQFFIEQADRLITRPKERAKMHSYTEMVAWVPPDNSSHEAANICRAFCGLLVKGTAPRVDFLVKMTGLPEDNVKAYLDGATWIRKDESSPAGIVVYFPLEAKA